MENFTPIASLAGGVLIGIASITLLYLFGRIAGISGIFGGILQARHGETGWRIVFVAGLVTGGLILGAMQPDLLDFDIPRSTFAILAAGVLVGIGARMGNGCTSGHGVCGLGRLSPRSAIAVAIFMSSGALTVYVVNHLFGGTL